MPKSDQPPKEWIDRYTRGGGWYRLDLAQRHLDSLIASMTEDPECEQARHVVQGEYEDILDRMAIGFAAALKASGWMIAGVRPQSSVYAELVEGRPGPVAMVLVDSMRYEMGVELRDQRACADCACLALEGRRGARSPSQIERVAGDYHQPNTRPFRA